MMKNFVAFLALAASVVLPVSGCSGSSNAAPDPTSREALTKAPPMESGTTCTKVEISSYGTAHSHDETPVCLQAGGDCEKMHGSEASDYGGGAAYNDFVSYKDVKWFEGTCADQKPISCAQRSANDDCGACQYKECCAPVAICEDDPNCVAVVDCVTACKADTACVGRCIQNGEPRATSNLKAAVQCVRDRCAAKCS
jgi:hypothetical protein